MASEAHGNVKKAMDAAREQELAAYIMRDVDLRQQNAQERGVLAYGKKPLPRSKPNNRFLQNTLKSVDFANRTVRENEMWEKWDPRKRSPDSESEADRSAKRRRGLRPSTCSDGSSDESSQSASEPEGDGVDIEKRLQAGQARGRGSTGPRADETGPFLFPTDEQERQEYEMMRHARKPAKGPPCPDWIRRISGQESHAQRTLDAQLLATEPTAEKKSKKDAKRKKKSKKLKNEKKKRRKHQHSST